MTVAASDLGTYLGAADIDVNRATYLISLATALCTSIVDPLPDGADAVVLDVVARAYGNPANVTQQTVGPYSASYGTVAGGLWLTRANKATLRRLGGGGGAFTIDTTPDTAGEGLPIWDSGTPGDWNDTW